MSSQSPIVVVGAGAAGLMAAIAAAGCGARVVLLERTRDGGRKILISGGGRCNVLPSALEPARFVTDSSRPLLKRLLLAWSQAEQRVFFERELGIPLALEPETGKLFPASNRARDVRDGLVALARARGVDLRFGVTVADLRPAPGGWLVQLADGAALGATRVILATGGLSVPSTGSDGSGLAVARRLGHGITDPYPALTPLLADPPVHAELAGVSLRVTVAAVAGSERATATGGFLFTHRGYSGPAVLDVSHVAVRARMAGGSAALAVRWGPRSPEQWEERLRERSVRGVLGVLREELPARLAEWLLDHAGLAREVQLAQLPREGRRALIERLVRYPLPCSGDEGYRKAEVTGGGVQLGEVASATLESRRHPGLHLCGELLDAFGPIGGHNFAWAWSTGRTAGLGAAGGENQTGGP